MEFINLTTQLSIFSSIAESEFFSILTQLLDGMLVTLEIFLLTLVFSLPLGLVISFLRMSKNIVIRSLTKLYISIMRGTPLMLQLMVVFYGPYFLFKISLSNSYRFVAVIIGFVLNYAAYFAEIYRSGIESMPVGQYEACSVLGFSKSQTFTKVILPQVVKRILPPVTNEIITLVKDTSLAFVLAVQEVFTLGSIIVSTRGTLMPFVVAGVFYYIFNLIVAWVMERVEKKLSYYR